MDHCKGTELFEGYKGVIFDFDGTLFLLEIDWNALRQRLHDVLLQEFGIDRVVYPMLEVVESFYNHRHIFSRLIEVVDEIESSAEHIPIEESIMALRCLKSSGKKIAILTLNTQKAVHRVLERHNLEGEVDMVLTFEDVRRHKPNPEGVERILSSLGLRKDEVLFIGDSDRDRGTARNAGVDFMHVDDLRRIFSREEG